MAQIEPPFTEGSEAMTKIKYGVLDIAQNKVIASEDTEDLARAIVDSLNSKKKREALKLVKIETVTTITITEV